MYRKKLVSMGTVEALEALLLTNDQVRGLANDERERERERASERARERASERETASERESA